MPSATEVHCLSPDLTVWQRYDPTVKVELFSTGLMSSAGVFLVDPIELDSGSVDGILAGHQVAGIVLTNANHLRAAEILGRRLEAPIFAHHDTVSALGLQNAQVLEDGSRLAEDLSAIEIEGAAPGEIALYWQGDGGTMVVGDALINLDGHEFTFLPAKYCSNSRLMRRSVRKLTRFAFERMLFAHGAPIMSGASARLATLLEAEE